MSAVLINVINFSHYVEVRERNKEGERNREEKVEREKEKKVYDINYFFSLFIFTIR